MLMIIKWPFGKTWLALFTSKYFSLYLSIQLELLQNQFRSKTYEIYLKI